MSDTMAFFYRCYKLTYFNNKVCLTKKRCLREEIVNFAIESLVLQNKLLIDGYSNLFTNITREETYSRQIPCPEEWDIC